MNRPPVFHVTRVPVPASGVVRVPGDYPHEFASMPTSWREITVGSGRTKFLQIASLDPASDQRAFRMEAAFQRGFDCGRYDP